MLVEVQKTMQTNMGAILFNDKTDTLWYVKLSQSNIYLNESQI